jgi:hypothetical protein
MALWHYSLELRQAFDYADLRGDADWLDALRPGETDREQSGTALPGRLNQFEHKRIRCNSVRSLHWSSLAAPARPSKWLLISAVLPSAALAS